MKKILLIGILFLVIFISGCINQDVTRYREFSMDQEGYLNYYADCTCVGELFVLERFPPGYDCRGTETCEDINIVIENEMCTKNGTDKGLSLSAALEISLNSECSQGNLEETFMCNENTGTWWLDLDIEKAGCNPACVVDVETREAEINWRCTGLIEP